jgi:hypothetical protein
MSFHAENENINTEMPDKITNEGKFNVVFCLTEGGQAERKL